VTKFAIAFLLAPLVCAQQPPTFDVASVKPDLSGGNGGRINTVGGKFTSTNSTLQALIRFAWDVKDYQIHGPSWMDTERYDIEAKPASGAGNREMKLMLQDLLMKRFTMQLRRETQTRPIYALVVDKGGPKLHPSEPADSSAMNSSNHDIIANKIPLSIFASMLSGQLDRLVTDATGLTGTYDIKLEWTPEKTLNDGALGATVFTAIREQLGLKLDPRTGPVEMIIVDKAERNPTEN
jgi:uncharacterized protein (TIGR03435 family)